LRIATVLGMLLVAGCAVPVPLQIASWALDGISYFATQKSMSDHGISLVMAQDCAMWRGFTEGEICRESVDDTTPALAENAPVQIAKVDNSEAPWQIAAALVPEIFQESSPDH
jgi:hypothetical protein